MSVDRGVDSEQVMKCCVCGQEAGGSHTCRICKHIVHLICGDPIGEEGYGEEGYGQSVKCKNCHLNETLIDYEYDSDLLGFDTNVVDEDGKIERNDVIEDGTNERVEIPEHLWNLIPNSGLYLKNIIQFSGYADVDSMLRLKKPDEMKKMFKFAVEMIDLVPNKDDMFGIFSRKNEKVCVLPGLELSFERFLNVGKLKPWEKSTSQKEPPAKKCGLKQTMSSRRSLSTI